MLFNLRSVLSNARPALSALLASAAVVAAADFEPARAAETVLYSFKGQPDGANPQGTLIADTQGALYGTTVNGGSHNHGTVFKLAPPAAGQTQWTESVLYSFTGGADGGTPVAGLILDTHGALYGTTQSGGSSYNAGIVFKLSPAAKTPWTESVLYTFHVTAGFGQEDGGAPSGRLIFDTQGALYGTTKDAYGHLGVGTVFKLSPPASGIGRWNETISGFGYVQPWGAPVAGLILDTQGALYGTAGGSPGWGEVFKVTEAGGSINRSVFTTR